MSREDLKKVGLSFLHRGVFDGGKLPPGIELMRVFFDPDASDFYVLIDEEVAKNLRADPQFTVALAAAIKNTLDRMKPQ